MAFTHFSLRGFRAPFSIRRQVEIYDGSYLVCVTLYRGKHLRRKMESLSAKVSLEHMPAKAFGVATALTRRLADKHRLDAAAL